MTLSESPDLLTGKEVAKLMRCSLRHIQRSIRDGKFPEPIRSLGPASPRWRRSDLEAWIAGSWSPETAAETANA